MKLITSRIPELLYRRIHALLPIVCVDLVVMHGDEFLLVKRSREPEKGKWWFPGGRIYKNERLRDAARRKLREETGIRNVLRIESLGVHEYFSKKGYFPGVSSHTLTHVFRITVKAATVHLDVQSTSYRWSGSIEKNLNPYLKTYLKKVGFGQA